MLRIIRRYKRIIKDLCYSFIAYALPTVVLQFAVQPLIADRVTADENGLFVALFNVIKLMIGVFIMPLANLRLLKKQECKTNEKINAYFNFIHIIAVTITVVVGSGLNIFYRGFKFDLGALIRLGIIILLMAIHDYHMIAFRLVLNFKNIVIDNCLIVIGYGIGMFLFTVTGYWECIFICGYFIGTIFVLLSTNLWKAIPILKCEENIIRQYGELGVSDLLKNSSTYCDRLIIFPVLGGYDVSVYNAAAVVSKAIAVVSSPFRNVLLSYIVNHNGITISKRKIKKIIPIMICSLLVVFFAFWGFSAVSCKILYSKYAGSAMKYIPVITAAIIVETLGAILNILLLRFDKTYIQTIISALKLGIYLLAVLLFAIILKMGLWGFCIAILLADFIFLIAVLLFLKRIINFDE